MPNLVRIILQGMTMIDHGTRFTVQTQHDLDPRLWRVRYSDGRDGVFDTDWLLNLANNGGLMMSAEQVADNAGPVQTAQIVTGTERTVTVLTPGEMDREHTNAFLFSRQIEDAHQAALDEWQLESCQIAATVMDRRRRVQAGRVQDIGQAHAQCLREWMATWHEQALVEHETRTRPPCPGCGTRYRGMLNVDHRCAPLRAASCAACGHLQEALLNVAQTQAIICQPCSDSGRIHCRKCGGVMATRPRGSRRVCDNCLPRQQFDVWRNLPRAHGDNIITEIGSHRPFSVEIESFNDPRLAVDQRRPMSEYGWAEGGDGSVHADQALIDWASNAGRSGEIHVVEFKSPPFTGDGGLLKLHDDAKKIRRMGFRANSSCGLHVHVDAAGFDGLDLRAIHKFGKWYEDEMYRLVAPSRTTNQYCRQLPSSYSVSDRYRWLNMASVAKHGTVEYRLHHGCTIPVRIAEWAKLCVKFTEAALKYGRARTRPATHLAETIGMSPYEKRYWQAISAELNPPPRPNTADGGDD